MIIIKKEFAFLSPYVYRRCLQIRDIGRRRSIIISPCCNKCRSTEIVSCLHFISLKKESEY